MDRATRDQHSAPDDPGPVRSWSVTHTGAVRHVNQDRYLACDDLGLWLVADGAGGHQGGGTAAQALVEEFGRLQAGLSSEAIVRECARALEKTHVTLRGFAREQNREAMSVTTAVVLILRGENLVCQWAGDSRAYRFRDRQLTLMTRDHSLVQELVDLGRISASEADRHPQRNIITRAVGADCETLEIASLSARVEPGDFYLLCSDGLSATLSDSEIAAAFDLSPSLIAGALVDAALAKRARDNVTAVVVSVPGHRLSK
jgi:serine/threonine-protein phosphatase Stp1